MTNGSPWALISIFPAAFQRKLGHSTSDRGHQALRYRSANTIAHYCYKSTDKNKRLTLGPDFILSHSVSGTARLPYGQPGSPGSTSRSINNHIRLCRNFNTIINRDGDRKDLTGVLREDKRDMKKQMSFSIPSIPLIPVQFLL
jgi:hypothetical protein